MNILIWIIVGLVAGWIAGQLMKGSGYGILGDLVLGLVGAIVGGWLFSVIAPSAEPSGLLGSILVATIGAVVVLFVARLLGARRILRA